MNNNLAMESKADESKDAAYCYAWEIEDFLQEQNVFQNALDGRCAHIDAYNTIIDYNLLESKRSLKIKTSDFKLLLISLVFFNILNVGKC